MDKLLYILFRPLAREYRYSGWVSGWRGWVELFGRCIAWRKQNGKLVFVSDLKG